MLSVFEIEKARLHIVKIGDNVRKRGEELLNQIAGIESEGRSQSWSDTQTRAARASAQGEMVEMLEQARAAFAPAQASEAIWNNKEYVMSKYAVSAIGPDGFTAANSTNDHYTRLGLIAQGNLMTPAALTIAVADAVSQGEVGKAALFASVGNSKGGKISTEHIPVPHRDAALEKIKACKISIRLSELDAAEASGTVSKINLSVSRLAAARGDNV